MPDVTPPAEASAPPPRRFRRLRVAVSVFFGAHDRAVRVVGAELSLRRLSVLEYLSPSIGADSVEGRDGDCAHGVV